jgi:uncharacterized membrane protein YgaE (UPF0421/DUF939 family)
VLARVRSRFDLGVVARIAQTALAAGAAWELALQIPDHGRPFFAPIAAVIALGAERGRRGRQAIQVITGVALGILIGATFVWLVGAGGWQLVVATATALAITTAAGSPPIIRVQAAASAILVVALHQPGSNLAWQRLIDALIGGGIAIVLARFLFPVDPLELVRTQARTVRAHLAEALEDLAAALEERDRERAEASLAQIDAVDDSRLHDALALARDVARAAPRRRPLRRRVEALGGVAHELEATVSDVRAMATGALRLLDGGNGNVVEAANAVRVAADAVRAIEPALAREEAERARAAARRLRARDDSLGASVLAHGIAAVADHTTRSADSREEERRLAGGRNRFLRLHVGNHTRR